MAVLQCHVIGVQVVVAGLQSRFFQFVQQGAIADVQRLRRLLAVPLVVLQDLQDDIALDLAYRLFRDFLQKDGAVGGDIDIEIIVLLQSPRFRCRSCQRGRLGTPRRYPVFAGATPIGSTGDLTRVRGREAGCLRWRDHSPIVELIQPHSIGQEREQRRL